MQAKTVEKTHAFLLEGRVAHGKDFVDHQHVGIHIGADGESKPRVHAGRILFHRLVDEGADVRERGNGIEPRLDFLRAQPEHRRANADIFPAGELGIESRAQLEHGRDAATRTHLARGRTERSADHLEERGFARAVAADNADRLAAADTQIHVPDRPELFVESSSAPPQQLLQPVLWSAINRIGLSECARVDDRFR